MFFNVLLLFLLINVVSSQTGDFKVNQYLNHNAFLTMNGETSFTLSEFLQFTNGQYQVGGVFTPVPLSFKNNASSEAFSFSTTFVFAIVPPKPPLLIGHGMAFVISPKDKLSAAAAQHMGLFNATNNGDPANHVLAIELDTFHNPEFNDIDSNHVGIDVNSLESVESAPAGYYSDKDGGFRKLRLASGDPMQVWIEYDSEEKQLHVTLHPIHVPRPNRPLLSLTRDLSPIILGSLYVGFSSATGRHVSSHYLLAWSFKMNGKAQAIDVSRLSSLPWREQSREKSKVLTIGLPLIGVAFLLMAIFGIFTIIRRRKNSVELLEDWELDYGQHRFFYKDLKVATRGFAEEELLGAGGFGKVYRGILPKSKTEVAVKRVSHGSQQRTKEFIAEIVSLGRLRHRNLVQLLGYCRRRGELLLVYELMPNGSLDKFIFSQPKLALDWSQRYRIVKGVASGLLYLHEEWEQVVIHRDIKASNVLLDREMNGRLGDFGLARSYSHGSDPESTHVAGTFGYLSPELARTGKATTSTDVFAFGVFMLEVACGRRPIERQASPIEVMLVDWVLECWRRGAILYAADPKLGSDAAELELVMKLGLLCSHPHAAARPTMRQVMEYLDFDLPMPELLPDDFIVSSFAADNGKDPHDHVSLNLSSVQASVLSGGR